MNNKKLHIVICKGLPASGKSTWCEKQLYLNSNYKRVNKDLLRRMFDNSFFSKQNEKMVVLAQKTIIFALLQEGYNILVDDTNLNPKNISIIKDMAKTIESLNGCSIEVKIKDFTDVPVKECVERDKLRGKESVGEKVIY